MTKDIVILIKLKDSHWLVVLVEPGVAGEYCQGMHIHVPLKISDCCSLMQHTLI